MSKKKEIFGKDKGLIISDIEKALESEMLYENDEIEFKNIDRMHKKERREKIVGELISFLNSGQGRGLLILGLDDDKTIKGVKTIKSSEQLRSLIFQGIKSVPSNINPVKLDITSIPYNNDQIFLVEIKNNELNYVYYSEYDNQAYIRRGDESKRLSISEFLEFISNKNNARIFIKLRERSDKDNYVFDIMLSNEGSEPGIYIVTFFNIFTTKNLDYSIKKSTLVEKKIVDIRNTIVQGYEPFENENNILISQFRADSGFPPKTMLSYPVLDGIIGEMIIPKDNDFYMVIEVEIHEKKGYSKQLIVIESNKNEIRIEDNSKVFKSYLNL